MTHKQKRILFNWLYKQGALHKYKKARYESNYMDHDSFTPYRQLNFNGAIVSGFDWRSTLEGSFYWLDMNKAWIKYLQRNDT